MSHRRTAVACLSITLISLGAAAADPKPGDTGPGGISPESIGRMRDSLEMDAHTRAAYNAITGAGADARKLAVNRDILRGHNDVFSHKIKVKAVTNQKKSGRCWLFAGLNIMRPAVIEKHNLDKFEFSQNYLAFWDKLEKANTFLEVMIDYSDRDLLDREMEILLEYPFPEGGWWVYVAELVDKYGVVPQDVMPETASSENSKVLHDVVRRKLKSEAMRLRNMRRAGRPVERVRAEKEKVLQEISRMLTMNLGEPPKKFSWRWVDKEGKVSKTRKWTPKSFYQKQVGIDLSRYVSLYHDPAQKFGRHYRLKHTRNLFDGSDMQFANVEVDVLKRAAMKSVLADAPVWFAADVVREQSTEHGIMAGGLFDFESLYGTRINRMTKAERILWREGVSNHAMVLMGVDVNAGKPVKWWVENSWGKERGSDGFWTLYDSWFDQHVYEVIVHRRYVPKDVLPVYEQEPIELPPWYPAARRYR